jgi:3-hydroxyisobutyrate dehydrogenase
MADQPGTRPSVALLGTGIMGSGMGHSILRAGLPLRAWNRTIAKAKALEPDGAQVAQTPAEAVAGAQVIVTMLADADAVTDAITAAAPGLHQGQAWAQVSTVGVAGQATLAALATSMAWYSWTHPCSAAGSPPSTARLPSSHQVPIRLSPPSSRSSMR